MTPVETFLWSIWFMVLGFFWGDLYAMNRRLTRDVWVRIVFKIPEGYPQPEYDLTEMDPPKEAVS